MSEELFQRWLDLSAPHGPHVWSSVAISASAKLARTETGAAILFQTEPSTDRDRSYALRTAHISYTPCREITVQMLDGEQPGSYCVLECANNDADLVRHFLRIASALPLSDDTPVDVFDSAIRRLFELFRNLSGAGRGSIQGLWAELLVISCARAPQRLIEAWHSDPFELHDFVNGDHRVEVKSSGTDLRIHEFSLEQLERDPGNTMILSILVQECGSGATVFDLVERARQRVDSLELVQRLEVIVGKILGETWREALEVRFDDLLALRNLRGCRASDVPRVRTPLPATVSHVRFRADVSGIISTLGQLDSCSAIIGAFDLVQDER